MVFRRRRTFRRRRPRRFRRRRVIARVPRRRFGQLNQYRCVLVEPIQNVTIAAASGPLSPTYTSVGRHFALNLAVNYNRFVQLYDQFRIRRVAINYFVMNYGDVSSAGIPTMMTYCIDYDDKTVVSANEEGFNFLMAKQGSRTFNFFGTGLQGKNRRISFKPKLAVGAYQSGIFSGYVSKGMQWVDSVSSAVEHYGLKSIIKNNTTLALTLGIQVKYWVDFRGVQPTPPNA